MSIRKIDPEPVYGGIGPALPPGPPEAGYEPPGCTAEPSARGEHGHFLAGYTPTPVQRARRFQPGQSGNPTGRKKVDSELKRILTAGTIAAAKALCDMVSDTRINPRVRCIAAEIILNRVYGKALQPIDALLGGSGDPVVFEFKGILDEWAK